MELTRLLGGKGSDRPLTERQQNSVTLSRPSGSVALGVVTRSLPCLCSVVLCVWSAFGGGYCGCFCYFGVCCAIYDTIWKFLVMTLHLKII